MCARAGLLITLFAATLAMVACAPGDGRAGAGGAAAGALVGQVTRGPAFPVSGPGAPGPPSVPVGNAGIRILDSKGAVAATARTDSDGLFRAALPPGQYRVERGEGFRGPTKSLPATVTIKSGRQTRLDIMIDTGIR